MPKQENLGTKRTDPETGKNFYDLNKDPVVSPYTGKEYPLSFFEIEEAKIEIPPRGDAKPDDPEEDDEDEDEDDVDDVKKVSKDDDDDEEDEPTPEIDAVDLDSPIPIGDDDDSTDDDPAAVPEGFSEETIDGDDGVLIADDDAAAFDDDDDVDVDLEDDLIPDDDVT